MKTEIAVICATPSRNNSGMVSVDMSVDHFLRECIAGQFDTTLFCVEKNVQISVKNSKEILYRKLSEPEAQLAGYNVVMFWGDFLHAYNYIEDLMQNYSRRERVSQTVGKDHLYRRLLFEGVSDELQRKVMILGGTLLINSSADHEPRYKAAISRLYKNCIMVAPREPVSIISSGGYGGIESRVWPGIDCAFFLKYATDHQMKSGANEEGAIGYSFGRGVQTNFATKWAATRFLKSLAAKLAGGRTQEVDWLSTKRPEEQSDLFGKIDAIRRCRAIVTDTYHCAITAWREGVPAVCLGLGSTRTRSTLNEKKKELLYLMFQAQEFYVFLEKLLLPFGQRKEVRRVASTLVGEVGVNHVLGNIAVAKERYIDSVKKVLQNEKIIQ